jgi:hypothetical protein
VTPILLTLALWSAFTLETGGLPVAECAQAEYLHTVQVFRFAGCDVAEDIFVDGFE